MKEQLEIHVRRRLSEFRDNYMSCSPVAMSLVKSLRKRLKSKY